LFFNSFPTIDYNFPNGKTLPILDIFKRVSLTQETLENNKLFDTYFITEGFSPEKIAFDYYGDPKFSWFLFMMNSIVDPHTEWPMDYDSFLTHLNNKYKGISFFIVATPELLPGDIIIKSNSSGTTIDQDNYSVILDWRRETRNIVIYGGEGTLSNSDYVMFLRKEGNAFTILNTNTSNNVVQLARRTVPNLQTPRYFIFRRNSFDEIISPYRILNGTNLTTYSADPNSNSVAVPGSYTDTTTLYNTVLYKYITNGLSSATGISVKTFQQYELDELNKRQTIKIPKQQTIPLLYDLYKRAINTDTLGRSLTITVNT